MAQPEPVQVNSWIELSDGGTTTVIGIGGELDALSRPAVEPVLLRAVAAGPPVVVDLGALSFCDSTGLSLLVTTQERATAAGSTLAIRNASPRIRRLLEITGIDTLIALGDSEASTPIAGEPPATIGASATRPI
jgi:anti-sigma B factor antagonist